MNHCKEQFRRREVVARARAIMGEGAKQGDAASILGIPPPTLSRWLTSYREGGTAELAPKQKGRCGRKKLSAGATEADVLALKRLKLATGSDSLSLQMWAQDARCTPSLREAIERPRASKHNLPRSLRQLCHVTQEEQAKFRGERALQLGGFVQRRDTTVVMDDGSTREIEPGDLWEFDDMSNNQPFWWESLAELDSPEERNSLLAQRQGACVGRQILFAQDVATGRWLGFEIVGRSRDAYRAADILRFMRRLFETYGLPRLGVRLERGIWRSKVIAGITLDDKGRETERPEMSDEDRLAVFGGLQEIGVSVDWCHSPNHKGGIEGGFNYLQANMAAVAVNQDRYIVDLGRKRGEFERATKALMQAHAGRQHPRDLGFLHIDEARELISAACTKINSIDEKEGRIQWGNADTRWEQSMRENPLRSLPKDKLWIFLPNESVRQLKGGHVMGQVSGIQHLFCCPELFARLGAGYPLRVRFDVSEPSLGAWLFNDAPRDDRRNVEGLAPGEYIGWAEYAPDAPQFDGARGFQNPNRKKFNAAVRNSFAALGLFGRRVKPDGSGHAVVISEHRDGAGGVNRVEKNVSPQRHEEHEVPEKIKARQIAPPDIEDLDALEQRLRDNGALIG